jgi:hypothetical protein
MFKYGKQDFGEDARIKAVREYQAKEQKRQLQVAKAIEEKRRKELNENIAGLTVHGRKILKALFRLVVSNRGRAVSTARLAGELGRRTGLTVWDRKILADLEQLDIIHKRSQSLTSYVKPNGKQQGRGRKFVYEFNPFVLDLLVHMKKEAMKNEM